jgi:two-component system sensor histidine kinase BaeS
MKRTSLITRLVVLSASVATLAATAMALLAGHGPGHRPSAAEQDSQLETDSAIEDAIASYALNHPDWSGVESLIIELAQDTGRRISLTEPDGTVIVDSAELLGQGPLPLPSAPSAQLDPTAGNRASGPRAIPADGSSRATIAVQGWQPTAAERQAREGLIDQANDCLAADGVSVTLDPNSPAANGRIFARVRPGDSADGAAAELRASECIPAGLSEPTAASRALNADQTDLMRACLTEAGLEYQESVSADGIRKLTPEVGEKTQAWKDCAADAHARAIDPYVAAPAELYLGVSDRFDPLGPGWWRTLGTMVAVIIIAAAFTVVAGRRVLRPIDTLTAAAQQMAGGDHSVRVPTMTGDEVGRLGLAFNAMAAAVGDHDQRRKALVGDIAHELRTPLTTVGCQLEAAEEGIVPIDRALIESIREETQQLQRLVDDLQDLALADAGMLAVHREERDAADLVREAVARYLPTARAADIALMQTGAEELAVLVDPGRIHQAVGNLIDNALHQTPAGGTISVATTREAEEAMIMVADTGPGIPADHLPYVFDRFYRADRSRSRGTGGSGLGLAITRHLIQAHGGSVRVESTPGEGARFMIRLPLNANSVRT